LEEAIRRATSLPADRLGLRDVGRIAEGYRADLVILDPATVADAGCPHHPAGPPTGIRGVLIAGRPALQGEPLTGHRPTIRQAARCLHWAGGAVDPAMVRMRAVRPA
ncbi:MAG TPA: amidohydrolase family protein, partial [Actinomycetes bacterium]|nr:amidohydrolase family protein [Actinomycetes bacterium]